MAARLVPSDWIAESTKAHLNSSRLYKYGYRWWLGTSFRDSHEIEGVAGFGFGGQRHFIVPALDLMVVVNCGL
jgi:CubicO group peptidase (beta-lactamase class C family)